MISLLFMIEKGLSCHLAFVNNGSVPSGVTVKRGSEPAKTITGT